MNNFDYIPIDRKVVDSYVKEFEQSRKKVLSKVRFDNGFDDSVIALAFMDELLVWGDPNSNIMVWSKVNIRHIVFDVAYDYIENHFHFEQMNDNQYIKVLDVMNRWSKAFKCAYDHSSTVNFSWAFRELLKEIKPLIG